MELRTSGRQTAKIRLSLQGVSGSGKSYSSLLIAFGLAGDWSKIAVIDTENGSADLYSHLGGYNVLTLSEPYSPERYIEALKVCENSGMEVVIIDSISHEWNGKGGCLEIHEQITASMKVPNSFTAWAAVTPRHQAFIDAILRSKCHVITTIRSKSEYVMTERNGKQVPMKVGMAPVTRDGFEYEVTISIDLDDEHKGLASKDRTGLFAGKPKFEITSETGQVIKSWCSAGATVDSVRQLIGVTVSVEELRALYAKYPEFADHLYDEFIRRKNEIIASKADLAGQAAFGGNGGRTI